MDDFEAPTFSLGLDFESQRPSFALGFDDDEEEHEIPASTSNQDHQSKCHPDVIDIPDSNPEPLDFQRQGSTSEPQVFPDQDDDDMQRCNEEPLPKLKRLRRGPPANHNQIPAAKAHCQTSGQGFELGKIPIDCDDIEDFSTDDEFFREDSKTPRNPSVRPSSSAKLSLSRSKAVTTPLFETLHCRPSVANIKNSSSINRGSVLKPAFGKIVDSVGKIQQSTCDFSEEEDDDLVVKSSVPWNAVDTKAKANVSAAKSLFGSQKMVEGAKVFESKLPSQDLRGHFTSIQNPSLATPAFDEFCEEYFSSHNQTDTNVSAENNGLVLDNSVPPAYQFFDNADMRIQRLLRQRLPNFLPINALMPGENQGAEQVEIDYLGQFGASCNTNAASGLNFQSQVLKSTRKKSTTSAGKGKKHAPGSTETGIWTTTGNRIAKTVVPRDAGKRRVSAKGNASGTWFTDAGRKVYITKDGREMRGQAAYMQYKKENGSRNQKSKRKYKKRAAKKK